MVGHDVSLKIESFTNNTSIPPNEMEDKSMWFLMLMSFIGACICLFKFSPLISCDGNLCIPFHLYIHTYHWVYKQHKSLYAQAKQALQILWDLFFLFFLLRDKIMGFRLSGIIHAMQTLKRSSTTASQAASKAIDVPKGYFAVYVGDSQKKRFLIPISYLSKPLF